ncbi:armadillo-like helical domain-containing protein 3 [Sycon ciliatum]|uniref:armadillo-like helical domain-containing protein 3 n=1 Tax=Sycon ciliatum TaxID=27933 RepID=UPI0031F6C543
MSRRTSSSSGGAASRPELREKFVSIYSAFLRGDDPSLDKRNFWEELFLLKVNVSYLEKALDEQSREQLLKLKPAFNVIFARCAATLSSDNQPICRVNALQTLCVLVRCIFRKLSGVDIINVLVGFERAVTEMQVLIGNISSILLEPKQASLKNLTFKFLLILVSAVDNISQNKMLEYLMGNNIFEPLSQILSTPEDRDHAYDCVVLLTFLLNYRKYESANPYIPKLSVLDNELVLNGLGVVISGVLSTVNRKHAAEMSASPGWLGSISSWVGGMFVAGDEVKEHPREAHSIILLSLYEAVHLNRNFMTILTQTHAQVPASPITENSSPAMARMLTGSSSSDATAKSIAEPVNLLGAFLTSASISMQDIKEGISGARARLCLNILTCICEDQYANAFLHDANMGFPVQLYKAPRRHRMVKEQAAVTSKPLACAILELVTELMLTHMCPKIQIELYSKCLGIIHRLLCYQKRCRIRLAYDWKGLWNALMSVGNFLSQNDKTLLQRGNVLDLATQDKTKCFITNSLAAARTATDLEKHVAWTNG